MGEWTDRAAWVAAPHGVALDVCATCHDGFRHVVWRTPRRDKASGDLALGGAGLPSSHSSPGATVSSSTVCPAVERDECHSAEAVEHFERGAGRGEEPLADRDESSRRQRELAAGEVAED